MGTEQRWEEFILSQVCQGEEIQDSFIAEMKELGREKTPKSRSKCLEVYGKYQEASEVFGSL